MKDFYKTKLTIEIEADTLFGPSTAIKLVKSLLDVPAITSIKLEDLDTDYECQTDKDENFETICNVPRKLK